MSRGLLALAATLLLACSAGRTEILVEVDTDLLIPDRIDEISIVAESPEGRSQSATAPLGPGTPLPRTLGMVHESGPLGPYLVTVTGRRQDVEVVRRRGSLTFQSGATLVWRVALSADCIGADCEATETCASGGCRSIEIGQGELVPWNGVAPIQDAGPIDACVPEERCNFVDDDCDGVIDEGFDRQTDPSNCGACGNVCAGSNAAWTCVAGSCQIASCLAPFADCDSNPTNGCEADTTSSVSHCGGCGMACSPPDRVCCASVCARDC